jgi:hypothetical protein
MIAAVNAKDEAALLALVDPKIRTTFGAGGGTQDFRKSWRMSSPDSPLWSELAQILNHGGSFRGEGADRSFWAPYVYSDWPESADAFESVAAIRAGVPIRQRPDAAAPEVATVDWAILDLIPEKTHDPEAAWRHVRTKDGKEGWARSADVRSPIDYRAGFTKRSGTWKMDALVAGD